MDRWDVNPSCEVVNIPPVPDTVKQGGLFHVPPHRLDSGPVGVYRLVESTADERPIMQTSRLVARISTPLLVFVGAGCGGGDSEPTGPQMDPGFLVGERISESMVVTSALNTGVLGRPITATAVEVSDLRVTSFFLHKIC